MRCADCCFAYKCSVCDKVLPDDEKIAWFAIGYVGSNRGRCCEPDYDAIASRKH